MLIIPNPSVKTESASTFKTEHSERNRSKGIGSFKTTVQRGLACLKRTAQKDSSRSKGLVSFETDRSKGLGLFVVGSFEKSLSQDEA
ncbi:hypothetical protein PGT21_011743 [Puccinia graminis f. sp. tritici]|uniref:Uncharacterized protein n=1 Tax=Puccinia graminis f. sp. tritici TaxID=56615 RepID=A0A5B0NPF7_PUCGR|nr:hypothetical protein PGTUg99_010465 [Puccinia graminis f. sp. tritici]KAA1090723.1 hypothetical protein PGT21_011743 [Puccinia graminis f. sp. tritici]